MVPYSLTEQIVALNHAGRPVGCILLYVLGVAGADSIQLAHQCSTLWPHLNLGPGRRSSCILSTSWKVRDFFVAASTRSHFLLYAMSPRGRFFDDDAMNAVAQDGSSRKLQSQSPSCCARRGLLLHGERKFAQAAKPEPKPSCCA